MCLVRRLPWRGAALAVPAGALVLAALSAAPQAGQYEQPPSFSAAQVLPANLLRSPYYTVNNQVGLDDFQYVFKVDTQWGPFKIEGADLMRVRAREIAATAKMEDTGAPRPWSTRRDAPRSSRSPPRRISSPRRARPSATRSKELAIFSAAPARRWRRPTRIKKAWSPRSPAVPRPGASSLLLSASIPIPASRRCMTS